MRENNTLRLLIVDESTDHAEAIAKALRNEGYALREARVETQDEFKDALMQQTWDLILCAELDDCAPQQAIDLLHKAQREIALIALVRTEQRDAKIALLRAGACDVIPHEDIEQLLPVISREFANCKLRRKSAHCQSFYQESERRCQALLESSRDAITYIHEGMHIYCNPAYLKLFGYPAADEIEGLPILDMIAPGNHEAFKKLLRRLHDEHAPAAEAFEFTGVKSDGSEFNAAMRFAHATMDGEPCIQVSIQDLSLDKEIERKLHLLRQQDLVTGLFNRQYFLERLEQAARGDDAGHTLLYIGLDNFDAIKDAAGIAGADLVLRDVAALIGQHCDAAAVAARFGDDVFTVLLAEYNDLSRIKDIATLIRDAINGAIFEVDGKSVTATCSIGITQIAPQGANAHDCLTDAESACSIARSEDGNGIHLHDLFVAGDQQLEQKDYWVRQIQNALNTDRFVLVFQPIVSLHAEPGERYEVLLRMEDENNQLVLPGKFLQFADEAGLMVEIDRWVIKKSISALAVRRRAGAQTSFFIKLSAEAVRNPALLPWISSYLKAARLPGDCLVFEVSEATLIENLKEAKAFTEGLRQLHCKVAVDHAGSTGHSYNYLKHIQSDFLKIDGAFVYNLSSKPENKNMLKELTAIAQANNKLTIAEFVHDANSLAVLWQYGVNFVQGYYLQKPEAGMNYDFSGE